MSQKEILLELTNTNQVLPRSSFSLFVSKSIYTGIVRVIFHWLLSQFMANLKETFPSLSSLHGFFNGKTRAQSLSGSSLR